MFWKDFNYKCIAVLFSVYFRIVVIYKLSKNIYSALYPNLTSLDRISDFLFYSSFMAVEHDSVTLDIIKYIA
jgi:hypothetical protein